MLPMMYMKDAIRATIELMEAPKENIKVRSAYNLGGISFTPAEISAEIQKHLPDFTVNYTPDFRQNIADTWPGSIDDSSAENDWDWQAEFNLETLVNTMLEHVDVTLLKQAES